MEIMTEQLIMDNLPQAISRTAAPVTFVALVFVMLMPAAQHQ
jgi:hypothetical protein